MELGPFENITFLGPDPLSVVRYAKKKRVQVHAKRETVTKITRQRRMKRQWRGSGQWAVGSGQWAVGSGQWAVAHHMKKKQLKGGATLLYVGKFGSSSVVVDRLDNSQRLFFPR